MCGKTLYIKSNNYKKSTTKKQWYTWLNSAQVAPLFEITTSESLLLTRNKLSKKRSLNMRTAIEWSDGCSRESGKVFLKRVCLRQLCYILCSHCFSVLEFGRISNSILWKINMRSLTLTMCFI